jgi:hypothetical protein
VGKGMVMKKKEIQYGINTAALYINTRQCSGLPPNDEKFREFCRTHKSFIPDKKSRRTK